MKIANITIGERHRKDLGDLQSLADSIAEQGLLQPIGITSTGDLVFGERRLKACQLLGWTEVSTRIVNVTSIAAGEYAENEVRQNFTPTERLAIATTLREESPGQWTDDALAKQAGLGSAATMYNVKRVVKGGIPELVEQMDRGEIAPTHASYVSELPATEQRKVLEGGPAAVSEVFRAARTSGRRPRTGESRTKKDTDNSYSAGLRRITRKPADEIRDRTIGMLSTVGTALTELDKETIQASPEIIERWTGIIRDSLPPIRRFLAACEAKLKVEAKTA